MSINDESALECFQLNGRWWISWLSAFDDSKDLALLNLVTDVGVEFDDTPRNP